MKYVKLRPVKRQSEIEAVKTRYAAQRRDLESLGFQEVAIFYDYAPPYHIPTHLSDFLFSLYLKRLVQDRWAMAWPLTYATICSLRYHAGTGTYVNTYGLGSIFYNHLPDSSLYITASWGGTDVGNDAARIYKRYAAEPDGCGVNILKGLKDEAMNPSSLAVPLARHPGWVRSQHEILTLEGHQPSLEEFARLSLIELVGLHPDL